MSFTIVVDEQERHRQWERSLENVVNKVQRRCRIGKVKLKHPKAAPKRIDLWKGWPFNGDPSAPAPMFMEKCGCRVGSACGNVACPHRLVATC